MVGRPSDKPWADIGIDWMDVGAGCMGTWARWAETRKDWIGTNWIVVYYMKK